VKCGRGGTAAVTFSRGGGGAFDVQAADNREADRNKNRTQARAAREDRGDSVRNVIAASNPCRKHIILLRY
jgi:hypothetical protein